ncbi:hypothetical protein ACFWH4_01210 [Streptomyces sp. NPDC127091]|uniref:hypothetical protein n=1 Tax=Streptomyces sp. NPDC127091 TaxID=3347134 RepID=UPI003647CAAC
MDLTALYVRDARRVIADVEAADITDPDLPHRTAVLLIVRTKEQLRTVADHAERQQDAIDRLQADKLRLESKVQRLKVKLANRADEKTSA